MTPIGHVLIDGERLDASDASISVLDNGLLRGLGCFEALRSYDGVAFRQRQHLDRLERSAGALGIRLPDRNLMDRWVADRASTGSCGVKVVVTGGVDRGSPRFIVFAHSLPDIEPEVSLLPVHAPWHPDGATWELTAAKTLSYGPNMAARQRAVRDGFGDALLVGRSGSVLEGPTNSLAWVADGVVETPSLDLGILNSVTRQALLDVAEELGVDVREGHYPVERVLSADEAMALSTFREVQPVTRIADVDIAVGPITTSLADGLRALIRRETTSA